MERKELLKVFKAAPWKTPADIDLFFAECADLTPNDLTKLLDTLTNHRMSADIRAHRARCRVFLGLGERTLDRSLFVPYLRALKNCDADLRNVLVTLLPKVNNIKEHPQLCALLRVADQQTRQAAAQVLIQVGGKSALQIVGEMLSERNFSGRMESLEVLANIAGHYAIPYFAQMLKIGKSQEKMRTLQFLGDPRYVGKDPRAALDAIQIAFTDPTELVLVRAIQSFCALCDEDAYFDHIEPFLDQPVVRVVQTAIEGLKTFATPRALSALERKLHAGPNPVRMAVLSVLEAIGTEEVLPPLVKALEHNELTIRKRGSEILADLSRQGKIDLTRTIIWLLRSRNPQVRRMAVDTAAAVPDKDAKLWPKLLVYLRDEDWWVRERVTDALVKMAGSQLTAHIVAYLSDESDVVRRFAIDVMIRLKDPKSLGALVRTAQDDSDWWVREKALEAIAEINDPRAVPYITDLMQREPTLRITAIQSLKQMAAVSAAGDVAKVLDDEDSAVRLAAIQCLDAFNDPTHAQNVLTLANDADPKVREAAQELLRRWKINFGSGLDATQSLSMLDQLLVTMVNHEGDDLIVTPGRRPYVKRMGKAIPLGDKPFTEHHIRDLILPHLSVHQVEELEALRDIDFSYEIKTHDLRFRANVFKAHGGLGMVFRTIKGFVLELEKLGLPPIVRSFGDMKNGLILVGGPTGSGKSTTLAAIIDYINRTSARHIISLEDPIEVVHHRNKGLVNQRELGTHAPTFHAALRSTLREDPDVIPVGELRDLETIRFAVTAAETGHLVFGTVHTVSADTSVDRLINAYPAEAQEQVRSMLSDSLKAVLCQYLLRRKKARGRVLAAEVMINNDAISNLIRKGKTFQIPSAIATGRDLGMQSMDVALMRLYRQGLVAADEVYMKANNKADFEDLDAGDAQKPPPAVSAAQGQLDTPPNIVQSESEPPQSARVES